MMVVTRSLREICPHLGQMIVSVPSKMIPQLGSTPIGSEYPQEQVNEIRMYCLLFCMVTRLLVSTVFLGQVRGHDVCVGSAVGDVDGVIPLPHAKQAAAVVVP